MYLLNGPYVKITEFENPVVTPVKSESSQFFYTRFQSGFEDVMAYYHIDSNQRYLQSLGFDNI